MSRSLIATSAATVLLLAALAGCGGGGGGGSSGGVSSSSSSSSTGVDNGTLKVMDDSFQITVQNAANSQFLTIAGPSQAAGAAIATAAQATTPEQKWHIIPMTGSQYNIENMLTHQVAGINAASTATGAGAVQYADNGTNDHLWNFYLLSDGNYLIKNVNSTLYLTADSSGAVTQGSRTASGVTQEWTVTTTTTAAYPAPRTVTGGGIAVHDPNMIVDGAGKLWLYGTHDTLASSTDETAFSSVSTGIFATDFAWWASKNTTGGGGRTDLWAPSVMFANGKYYQYYSIPIYDIPGTAGTNNGAEAVIALATSPNPDGPWTDAGQIIASCGHTSGCTTGFNAIDPAPYIDASGKWWLSFGSFEDGIHVLALDPSTGLRLASDMTLRDIAKRGAGEEGSFILPWTAGGTTWYYYFASINVCCSATSPYRIIVGRSASPTGPFLDRGGLDLHNGGGTLLLSAHGHVQGPGGQSVVAVAAFRR
ncbi:MAG: family 43 glycosylhydrolase [Asticcacaulis sp.]